MALGISLVFVKSFHFSLFEIGSHCVTQAGFEFAVQPRLASNWRFPASAQNHHGCASVNLSFLEAKILLEKKKSQWKIQISFSSSRRSALKILKRNVCGNFFLKFQTCNDNYNIKN
jgi:hypothetical protein